MNKTKTSYKKPAALPVELPELMELISTSDTGYGDPSTGRGKEVEEVEEEPKKIETGIPTRFHNIWEEEE